MRHECRKTNGSANAKSEQIREGPTESFGNCEYDWGVNIDQFFFFGISRQVRSRSGSNFSKTKGKNTYVIAPRINRPITPTTST